MVISGLLFCSFGYGHSKDQFLYKKASELAFIVSDLSKHTGAHFKKLKKEDKAIKLWLSRLDSKITD